MGCSTDEEVAMLSRFIEVDLEAIGNGIEHLLLATIVARFSASSIGR